MICSPFSISSFKLSEQFINQFRGKQPEWGPLGYFTYKRTYARYLENEHRKEEFWETLRRVVEGTFSLQKAHCKNLMIPWDESKAKKSAKIMYKKMWNFKLLPPGRGLWIMGTNFIEEQGSAALNNCGFVSTEDIDVKFSLPFKFLMDCLLVGVGIGFDTKGANKIIIKEPKDGKFVYIIPDSREGWIKALELLLDAYFLGNKVPNFDFSNIRQAGSPIKRFGGIAPGPIPLKNMLTNVQQILHHRISKYLTSEDIVDIMNLIGTCVIAGGIRRSAEIALGNPSDDDFIMLKQDDNKLYTHRWVSNNSVITRRGEDYTKVSNLIAKNGEPGVFWLDNARKYSRMGDSPDYKDKKALGINPCGEQTLESYELCCLVETFPSKHESYEEFQETLKYAYIYAKSVTLLNTHWELTNAVMLKNRRIGISQTGIVEAIQKHGRDTMMNWCDKGYMYLKELDVSFSDWLCIPKSIKLTTVKPSGTISLLPGVSPGIHFPHSKYYIRRIRVSKNSNIVKVVKDAGYRVSKDLYSEDTFVIDFPIHESNIYRFKKDVSIWEQAENAAFYQKYWSDNQVSITVTFKQEEAKEIKYLLECFEDKLKSISFLPFSEHGYKQAPYEEISENVYLELKKDITPLQLEEITDRELGALFCDSEGCEIHIKRL
ncbi:MAG: fused protease/ribonucleoside-triphosphate reductase [Promethearchaeota archaeon]